MTDFKSFGLINFLIIAHYEEKWRKAVENGVNSTTLPVVALTGQQAVIVEGNKIKIVGMGTPLKFHGFEEYE